MTTVGTIRERIAKVLGIYSVNGVEVDPTSPAVADVYGKMGTAVDMTLRKIAAVCGLITTADASFTADENGAAEIAAPDGFIDVAAVTDASGKPAEAVCEAEDGVLRFKTGGAGDYTATYRKFPSSVEEADEDDILPFDDYVADIVVYGAAAELCDSQDREEYSRLKYKCDELIANRFNVDKYKAPPFNRVYGVVRKRGTVWRS